MLVLSRIRLSATPWTVACQAPLSRGFPRQEYWSGLSFPPPGDLPNPEIKPPSPVSPALTRVLQPLCHLGSPNLGLIIPTGPAGYCALNFPHFPWVSITQPLPVPLICLFFHQGFSAFQWPQVLCVSSLVLITFYLCSITFVLLHHWDYKLSGKFLKVFVCKNALHSAGHIESYWINLLINALLSCLYRSLRS